MNATAVVPPFAVGTKSPVTVVATQVSKIDWFGMSFVAKDTAGNEVLCDPVVDGLLREGGSPDAQTWSGLPDFESKVTIIDPESGGVRSVSLDVNGVRFHMAGLSDGEQRSIDVGSAMTPGRTNTISATALGNPGSTATIMIAN